MKVTSVVGVLLLAAIAASNHQHLAECLDYNEDEGGAVVKYSSMTRVEGIFTVPNVTVPSGNSNSTGIWIGIDGYHCKNSFLRAGVQFSLNGTKISYHAWSTWGLNPSYFDQFDVSAGDNIKVIVQAYSNITGRVTIENLTTRNEIIQDILGLYGLCQTEAVWMVGISDPGTPLIDFGNVMFSGANYKVAGGLATDVDTVDDTYGGATVVDIKQNGDILTSCTTLDMDKVSCRYVG